MEKDQTPINARPQRQRPEALEDLSLALRDRLLWPAEDYFRSLSASLSTSCFWITRFSGRAP